MNARTLRFVYEVGIFVGVSLLLVYVFFGSWLESQWQQNPFRFWFVFVAVLLLVLAGIARRALRSFHPDSEETKAIDR